VRNRLVLLAALGDLGVFAGLGFLWHETIAYYHLHRLHREPDYLGKLLGFPGGTAGRTALVEYLEGRRGKQALIRECLRRERAFVQGELDHHLTSGRTAHVTISLNQDRTVKLNGRGDRRWWVCNSHDPVEDELQAFLDEHLPATESLRLPEYPGITFDYRR
jgi:hypothetical protein